MSFWKRLWCPHTWTDGHYSELCHSDYLNSEIDKKIDELAPKAPKGTEEQPYCEAQVGGMMCGRPVSRWGQQCKYHDPEGKLSTATYQNEGDGYASERIGYKHGFNDCLAEIRAKLNIKPLE